jgi:hypothetical protein
MMLVSSLLVSWALLLSGAQSSPPPSATQASSPKAIPGAPAPQTTKPPLSKPAAATTTPAVKTLPPPPKLAPNRPGGGLQDAYAPRAPMAMAGKMGSGMQAGLPYDMRKPSQIRAPG